MHGMMLTFDGIHGTIMAGVGKYARSNDSRGWDGVTWQERQQDVCTPSHMMAVN